jgi:predicted membrane protein DUF2207
MLTFDPAMIAVRILIMVGVYYFILALFFRIRARPRSIVSRYHPPEGLSPTAAAYFIHPGDIARALAVCLVDMSQQGALRIRRLDFDGSYAVERGNDHPDLDYFEISVRDRLLDCPLSPAIVEDACAILRAEVVSLIEPKYASPHKGCLYAPFVLSVVTSIPLLAPLLGFIFKLGGGRLGLAMSIAFIGGSLAVGYWAVQSMTVITEKFWSWLPGHIGPGLPLQFSDFNVLWSVALASLVFIVFASFNGITNTALAGSLFVVNYIGRFAIRTPTQAGWVLYEQLQGFKQYLQAVESEHLDRANAPQAVPKRVQENLAYALALDAEHAWAEQFSLYLRQTLVSAKGKDLVTTATADITE